MVSKELSTLLQQDKTPDYLTTLRYVFQSLDTKATEWATSHRISTERILEIAQSNQRWFKE
jgi:hypothetical protein